MPKPKGERTIVTRLRLPLTLWKAIQRMAEEEQRTAHNMMLVLVDYGYLGRKRMIERMK